MLRLLANRLLKKNCWPPGKRHANGGKMKKKMNVGGEPKETAVSREIVPADGSSPAQRGVRHVPAYDRQQLISHRRAWQTVKLAVIYPTHPSMHAGPLDFHLLLDLAPQ